MAKKKIIDEKEQELSKRSTAINEMQEKIAFGILPKNPTRFFHIDERVKFGAHNEVYIREIFENGLYYKIECFNVQRQSNNLSTNEFHYATWVEIHKFQLNKESNLTKNETTRLTYLNSGIESLLYMIYYPGVDFDVDYQRDYVWGLNDKVLLIDSIFNNIDIGKFTFVQRDFSVVDKLFEILDGKQRLTAIREFYDDRFRYKGFFFSELSNRDINKFLTHHIAYCYLIRPTKKEIYETFIKLNTTGRVMTDKDLDNVRNLANKLN